MKLSRNILSLVLLFVIVTGLQGCFEIIEDLSVKKNGSGVYSLTVNMSQSRIKLHSVMTMDSINGRKVPKLKDISAELEKIKATLKQVKGISAVSVSEDHTNFIYNLRFEFDNFRSLNEAITKISKEPRVKSTFSFNGNLFERKIINNATADVHKADEKDTEPLKTSTFTSIFRFESEVKSVSHPEAKISKSGKSIMLKQNLHDLATGKKNISNKIELKP